MNFSKKTFLVITFFAVVSVFVLPVPVKAATGGFKPHSLVVSSSGSVPGVLPVGMWTCKDWRRIDANSDGLINISDLAIWASRVKNPNDPNDPAVVVIRMMANIYGQKVPMRCRSGSVPGVLPGV